MGRVAGAILACAMATASGGCGARSGLAQDEPAPDARELDAAVPPDAGPRDAGTVDGGSDAGSVDGGSPTCAAGSGSAVIRGLSRYTYVDRAYAVAAGDPPLGCPWRMRAVMAQADTFRPGETPRPSVEIEWSMDTDPPAAGRYEVRSRLRAEGVDLPGQGEIIVEAIEPPTAPCSVAGCAVPGLVRARFDVGDETDWRSVGRFEATFCRLDTWCEF